MEIANPIYDVVFKYLMEDSNSAKLLLSTIINESIDTLDLLPQEYSTHLKSGLTVYRLDFCAKIKIVKNDKVSYKQVLIEIQKAKLASDIMRFRRYLGEQYAKKSNVYAEYDEKNKEMIDKPLPIISIYFLGYRLENIHTPVVKINRRYYDVANSKPLDGIKEDFVESLTHDSYVIQISQLREQHKTDVEQLLAIFNQHKHLVTDEHILDIDEQHYPQKYHTLIRRLQRAIAEPKIRKTMDMEDDVIADFQRIERRLAKRESDLDEHKQIIDEQQQALQEKDYSLQEKDQSLQEKDQSLQERDQLITQLKKQLKAQGKDV